MEAIGIFTDASGGTLLRGQYGGFEIRAKALTVSMVVSESQLISLGEVCSCALRQMFKRMI